MGSLDNLEIPVTPENAMILAGVVAAQAQTGPVPFLAGSFALYLTPEGGIHVSYRPTGADADEHLELPPVMVAMARKFSEGGGLSPMDLLKIARNRPA